MDQESLRWIIYIIIGLIIFVFFPSLRLIGPTEVGLVIKRFSFRRLAEGNPVAFRGEAGYQAPLMMPGIRFKLWILYRVIKYPWVQIPAGQIGVVIAQVGEPLPVGAKTAIYKKEFGNFSSLQNFIRNGGQKGVQRPTLPPGTLIPVHPVAFLIITKDNVFGLPVSPELDYISRKDGLTAEAFGIKSGQLQVLRIEPKPISQGKTQDMIGIVTTYEGDPLPSGDLASRLGGYTDVLCYPKPPHPRTGSTPPSSRSRQKAAKVSYSISISRSRYMSRIPRLQGSFPL